MPRQARVQSPTNYYHIMFRGNNRKNIIIRYQQKRFILGYFSDNQDQFAEFHRQKDDNEYMNMKEDIEKERLDRGQGLIERRQVIKNQVNLDELIQNLIKNSRLTHTQSQLEEKRSKKNHPLCFLMDKILNNGHAIS